MVSPPLDSTGARTDGVFAAMRGGDALRPGPFVAVLKVSRFVELRRSIGYPLANALMQQLAKRMFKSVSTMTRVVSQLVRRGYVKRRQDPEDRRVVHVAITPHVVRPHCLHHGPHGRLHEKTDTNNDSPHPLCRLPDLPPSWVALFRRPGGRGDPSGPT